MNKTGALLVFGLLLLASRAAHAQGPSLTLGASYDAFYREFGFNTSIGGHADVGVRLAQGLDVVGEFGLNHYDDGTVTSYQGGVRGEFIASKNRKVSAFGQFLLGAWHCCGVTEFMLQPGGGVDINVGLPFDIRAAYDYRHLFFSPTESSQRVSAGIVKRF
jgi:hypothetical protein